MDRRHFLLDMDGVLIKGRTPDTYMVGDNLRTDIRGGREADTETILVLSGVTSEDEIASSPPNHVIGSVAEIEL
jgi:NagD protein